MPDYSAWAEAFRQEHRGQMPWEDVARPGLTPEQSLAEHLVALEWSKRLGRAPTRAEWEAQHKQRWNQPGYELPSVKELTGQTYDEFTAKVRGLVSSVSSANKGNLGNMRFVGANPEPITEEASLLLSDPANAAAQFRAWQAAGGTKYMSSNPEREARLWYQQNQERQAALKAGEAKQRTRSALLYPSLAGKAVPATTPAGAMPIVGDEDAAVAAFIAKNRASLVKTNPNWDALLLEFAKLSDPEAYPATLTGLNPFQKAVATKRLQQIMSGLTP